MSLEPLLIEAGCNNANNLEIEHIQSAFGFERVTMEREREIGFNGATRI